MQDGTSPGTISTVGEPQQTAAGSKDIQPEFSSEQGMTEAYVANLKLIVEQTILNAFKMFTDAQIHSNAQLVDARNYVNRLQSDSLDLKAKIDNEYLRGLGTNNNIMGMSGYTALINNGLVQAQAQDQQRIAHDRTWNPDEVAAMVTNMIQQLFGVTVSKDAILKLIVEAAAGTQVSAAAE